MNREEKVKFIQEEILSSVEAIEFLEMTRARLNVLMKKGRIVPVKELGKGSLFLKDDLIKIKKELEISRPKYHPNVENLVKPMIATFPNGNQIQASSRGEMVAILENEYDKISPGVITRLARTGESFVPKLHRHKEMAGMTIKYIEE